LTKEDILKQALFLMTEYLKKQKKKRAKVAALSARLLANGQLWGEKFGEIKRLKLPISLSL